MSQPKLLFIPGGTTSTELSKKVLKLYSELLGMPIELLTYPEFIETTFEVNIASYKKYFVKKIEESTSDGSCVVIISFSLGTYFALELATYSNLKIKGLILISPFLKKSEHPLRLIFNRIFSQLTQNKSGKEYSNSIFMSLRDLFIFKKQFINQFKNIIQKINFENSFQESTCQKLIILGKHDRVIAKYTPDELQFKNSEVFILNGNHDIITDHHMEIKNIIIQSKILTV